MSKQQVYNGIIATKERIHRCKDYYTEDGVVVRVHVLNSFHDALLWHGVNMAVANFTRFMREKSTSCEAANAMDLLCQTMELDNLDDLIALCKEESK